MSWGSKPPRQYTYKALGREGKLHQGTVLVSTKNDLVVHLKKRGLSLVSARRSRSRLFHFRLRSRHLMDLALYLEQSERAGISLTESLEALRDSYQSSKIKGMLGDVRELIEGGCLLSEALEKHRHSLDPFFSRLCQVGEKTGRLSTVFHHLFAYYKWQESLEAQTIKALRYPLLMAGVLLGSMGILLGFFVPELVSFMQTFQEELPLSTRVLLSISSFLSVYVIHLFVGGIAIWGGLKLYFELSPSGQLTKDRMIERIPFFGAMRQKIQCAHFFQQLSLMVDNDIDLLQALQAARGFLKPGVLQRRLTRLEAHVTEGNPFSKALEKERHFPPLVIRMIRSGEGTSSLKVSLHYVNDYYDRLLKRQLDLVIGLIEPSMILLMGGVIVWIIMSVFLPLYDSLTLIDY